MLSCNKSSKLSPSRSGRLSPSVSAPRPPSELLLTTCGDAIGHGSTRFGRTASDGGSQCQSENGDEPEVHSLSSVRDLIASSFAAAQLSLAESHERALVLLSKCVDEAHRSQEGKLGGRHSPSNASGCQASFKPGHEREGPAPAGFQGGAERTSIISIGNGVSSVVSDTILVSDLRSGRDAQRDTLERAVESLPLRPQANSRSNSPMVADTPLFPLPGEFQLQGRGNLTSPSDESGVVSLPSDADEHEVCHSPSIMTHSPTGGEVCHRPDIMMHSATGESIMMHSATGEAVNAAPGRRVEMQRTISEASSCKVVFLPSEVHTTPSTPESGGGGNTADDDAEEEIASPTQSAKARRISLASVQSLDANQHFDLLPLWTRWTATMRSRKKISAIRKLTRNLSKEDLAKPESEEDSTQRCKVKAMHPASVKRAAWDVFSLILVLYDMVMIPLFFFDITEHDSILAMKWVTRMFWTFDIGASFLTGILQHDGTADLKLRVIARRYLRTYFVMDIAIVGIDWFEVFLIDASSHAGTASRSIRGLRLVRLLRLARIINVFMIITERIENEQMVIVAGIVKIMLLIMGLGHIIACLWYGLATMDRPDTWLKVHNLEDTSLDYKYTTSLHWALLQFAGGTDEVVPQNTWERVYSIIVFLVAFVVAAVFLGRLTSSMTKLHMLASKDFEKLHVLRRYLQKNRISGRLARRVQHNAHHALFERQRFMEESTVELLEVISDSLRAELHFELYSPVLAVHPFFRAYIEACPQVIQRLCHAGLSQLLVSAGDVVFMLGEVPVQPRMLIVCSGRLTYHYATGAVMYVEPGQWISEAVLWTSWVYRGMLTAASDCRLCVVNAAKFQELADTLDHPDFDLKMYAQAFIDSMNSGMMECSDLPFGDDCETLMEAIEGMSHHHLDIAQHWYVEQTSMETDKNKGRWSSFFKRASSAVLDRDATGVVPLHRQKSVLMTPL